MRIFEFTDYKSYLRKRLQLLPGRGRGEISKMARHLGVHTTMMSHVLRADAHFSLEQALKLADYLTLNELETDYLVALIQWERAADTRARAFCLAKVNKLRAQALNLKDRLEAANELSDADRAIFYSSWLFTGIRLLASIDRFQTLETMAAELDLPPKAVRSVLDFLVSKGLCKESKGRYVYAQKPTYVDAASPMVVRHHLNWRHKSQQMFERLRDEDLVFTYPTTISEKDFQVIREKLVQFIEEFKKTTAPSPSENLYCLNLDWIRLSGVGD